MSITRGQFRPSSASSSGGGPYVGVCALNFPISADEDEVFGLPNKKYKRNF